MREACLACGSARFKRNGHLHTGQQNHQGKVCGRPCVLEADYQVIGEAQRPLVERLRCEKSSLHGFCRAVGVSLRGRMGLMVARFAALPDHLHVLPVAAPRGVIIGRLEVKADERWSFVANKANKQGVWITMDQHTRHIIACHVGERRDASGHQWWVNLLAVSRERAMFSPDHYAVSTGVIPATQHKAMTKHARKTHHSERFTNTMRPRVSRLVRDTLACAKQLANHIGALTYFLCQYNLTRAAA